MEYLNYNLDSNNEFVQENNQKPFKIFRGDIFMAQLYSTFSKEKWNVPVVVIQNNIGNRYSPNVIVAAITDNKKKELVTHMKVDVFRPSTILCEQIYTINKTQLKHWLGKLTNEQLNELNDKLQKSLGIVWID